MKGKREHSPASGFTEEFWGHRTESSGGEAHNELVDGIRDHAKGTNIWAMDDRKNFHKGKNEAYYSK